MAFKTKKDIEKELEKEEILDECVLYEKDYLDVFGDVIPWKKTRICISDNWIMVETAEQIKNGAKNKGLVFYVRRFFLRSKINKIEIKDNDGPICLQATYSDEFSENIIKYSKSSIDISDVKKACDFLRCRVEDGKTEVNCKPKSRFKKCSICEKFVCQDEKVCPNCGHAFAKYM